MIPKENCLSTLYNPPGTKSIVLNKNSTAVVGIRAYFQPRPGHGGPCSATTSRQAAARLASVGHRRDRVQQERGGTIDPCADAQMRASTFQLIISRFEIGNYFRKTCNMTGTKSSDLVMLV